MSQGLSLLNFQMSGINIEQSYFYFFIFSEFLSGLSQFSVKGDPQEKLKCKFNKFEEKFLTQIMS